MLERLVGAAGQQRGGLFVALYPGEHFWMPQRDVLKLCFAEPSGAARVLVGYAFGLSQKGWIADEREAQLAVLPLDARVIEAQQAPQTDEDAGFLRGFTHRRGQEILARLHFAGGEEKGAVTFFDNQITTIVGHDHQDDQEDSTHTRTMRFSIGAFHATFASA